MLVFFSAKRRAKSLQNIFIPSVLITPFAIKFSVSIKLVRKLSYTIQTLSSVKESRYFQSVLRVKSPDVKILSATWGAIL